jgi:hypothetical protein
MLVSFLEDLAAFIFMVEVTYTLKKEATSFPETLVYWEHVIYVVKPISAGVVKGRKVCLAVCPHTVFVSVMQGVHVNMD